MRYKNEETTREPAGESQCRHFWIIEAANGPTSQGVCKFCGMEKEFYNSWPDYTVVKRATRASESPELPEIELDEEWDDSELEASGANLRV